jgi:TonB family protein
MAVSIPLRDFAPGRLVCLAGAFKRHYGNRQKVLILIFSSGDAAKFYAPRQGDDAGDQKRPPRGSSYWKLQLHGTYSYDKEKSEEFLDLSPMGFGGEGPYNTRIRLPASGALRCRLQINERCLLAMTHPTYPAPLSTNISGTVTLTGTIARNGRMTHVQVAETSSLSSATKELLTHAAITNLSTWRFEPAQRQDAVRITFAYLIDPTLPQPESMDLKLILPNEVTLRARP